MRRIQLREHETLEGVELSTVEIDALVGSGAHVTVSPMAGAPGRYAITPSSWVGLVRTPECVVEIQPKIPVDRLLFLLGYAAGRRFDWAAEAGVDPEAGVYEAVVEVFTRHVRAAFARGVLQGYRTEEEALPGVRGRIRFEEQIRRRQGIFPPVEVRFDDFTEDTDRNRVIKAALHRLGQMALRSDRSYVRLRAFDRALERVQLVRYHAARLPEFGWDRLNDHYRPAVDMALLILRATSFEMRHGAVAGWSLLFDMNKVFEDFVVVALREALRVDEAVFPQGGRGRPLFLDRARRVRLRPDFSWWRDGRCVAIGDVKYKRTNAVGVLHPDLYQVLAYAIATGIGEAHLVYAAGEDEPVAHVVEHAGRTLRIHALDLAGPPDALLGEIERIAGWLRGAVARRRGVAVLGGVS